MVGGLIERDRGATGYTLMEQGRAALAPGATQKYHVLSETSPPC
jgi:hypothetical protein